MGRYIQSIETQGSSHRLIAKKTIAHDDVSHIAMARKILKKMIDIARRIKLTVNFNATTLKFDEKFAIHFHITSYSATFAQGRNFIIFHLSSLIR